MASSVVKVRFVSPKLVPAGNPRSVKVWNRAVFSSVDGLRWNYNLHYDASTRPDLVSSTKNKSTRLEDDEEEVGGESERKVKCEVEVVSWRERRIKAEISVGVDVDSVWNALTDYERLADFVPNLVRSKRIRCPFPGRVWLEQVGFQRALYWHIEARVVLDLQEFINSDLDRELHFSMVDGDFKKFEGKWFVKCGTRSSTSILSYEVSVIPRFNFPAIFLERIIRSDLPVNLRALACRAESRATSGVVNGNNNNLLLHPDRFNRLAGLTGSNAKSAQALRTTSVDRQCMVDEVHLRRFDGLLENGGVHRFVVASITVKAPVREVWNVLTAYERLPEIVPHLAISKILSRENNKVRILQEGCKGLLYMVLHARVVLELIEVHEQEIGFEQVEGDFDSLRGKWILEQLGNQHTLLKYTVESKMHKDTFLSEAIMEEVIYKDLPSNLCAIRDHVEKSEADEPSEQRQQRTCFTSSESGDDDDEDSDSSTSRQRPRVPGLQRDIEILKAELLKFIGEHGQGGYMPMRKQLRSHGRVDIEKAITRMGGFRRIASLMNLSLSYKYRKPKGYWNNLDNLQQEISGFQRKWGMDLSFMPSRKTFERAGRYDIARALEKWGGLQEVARLLSLKPRRHPNTTLSTLNKTETNVSLSPNKNFDINWVE